MGVVTVGVDVGQKSDPTAVAVIEAQDRYFKPDDPTQYVTDDDLVKSPAVRAELVAWTKAAGVAPRIKQHHVVRLLERMELGTRYPAVVARLVEILDRLVARTGIYPILYVDATGVGQPIVDMLYESDIKASVQPVYFTHGDRRIVKPDGQITLGKAWMVSRLQALLQTRRLHLPSTRDAATTGKELLDYEIRVNDKANDTYGAFKVGTHDDLVTAIGLATQNDGAVLPFSWKTSEELVNGAGNTTTYPHP